MTGASRISTTRHLLGFWVVAALAVSMASPAWAVIIAYEGFDYAPDADVVGLGSATDGWAGPWDAGGADGPTVIQSGSLGYTDSMGNALTTSGHKMLNAGDASISSQEGRNLAQRRATDGTSTWISFLGQRIGERNSEVPAPEFAGTYRRGANFSLFDTTIETGTDAEKLNIGESSNAQYPLEDGSFEDRWQTRQPRIPAAIVAPQPFPPTNPVNGALRDVYSEAKFDELSLFVMRIDHVAGVDNALDTSGNDNVHFWLNPLLSSTPSDDSASGTYISADIVAKAIELGLVSPYVGTEGGEFSFDRFRLFAGNNNGNPEAQWLIDEIRVGESFADVTPHTPAVTGVPGDYNENDVVDAADYVVWRDNPATLPNEGATPGVIDQDDYDFWRTRFGATSAAGAGLSAAVPEPATCTLVALACAAMLISRRGRS
jgi:hypothetical protein